MRRVICILLCLALAGFCLSGCDRRSESTEENTADGSFSPETTAAGGLTQALEEPESSDSEEGLDSLPSAESDASEWDALPTANDVRVDSTMDSPFASPTPQPNASVDQYVEVSASGLGFRFSHPADWVNIPGRFTVCYVQPLEEGTVYPARVSVTMKRMLYNVSKSEVRTEFANFFRKLMTQYASFKVDTKLDRKTKFMGRNAFSTTYEAYDGKQQIKGYAIITYFERYLFVFHFLCAYEDYPSFDAALRYMRDSVAADGSVAPQ